MSLAAGARSGPYEILLPSGVSGPSLRVVRLDTRLDTMTGARTPWRVIRPPDPIGVVRLEGLHLTPDGRSYVYNIRRIVSTLFVVEGLE